MRPAAALLEQLSRSRLLPVFVPASGGTGERRSRRKGAGLEFAGHRPYREGDDARRLDPQVLARTGQFHLREYALDQQLAVTVVLDTSASMASGGSEKFQKAQLLVQALAFVALAGGDRVQMAVPAEGGHALSPRWQGASRADDVFGWIARHEAGGRGDFPRALAQLDEVLPQGGLVVAISDWWDEGVGPALDRMFASGREMLGIEILTRAERDPGTVGAGLLTIADSETGEELELALDPEALAQYRLAFATHEEQLRALFKAKQWRFFSVSAEEEVADVLLLRLRGAGVVR